MRLLRPDEALAGDARAAITIGVYDGVHEGHRWLLRRLRKVAGADAPLVVATFDPHPLAVIRPVAAPKTLTSTAHKLAILRNLGIVDACVVIPFDEARREQRARAFVEEVLVGHLHAACVMVGNDFRFGNEREGDLELLHRAGREFGFAAYGAPLLPVSSVDAAPPCSSTYIRGLVRAGRVDLAARLLGRPHLVSGTVAATSRPRSGRGLPTVVVRIEHNAALPVEGSYLGALVFPDGRRHMAGLSIRQGIVAGPDALVDAHLGGDFTGSISNDVTLEFERALWASGRAELLEKVSDHADETGQATAAGGWGAAG